MAEPTQHTVAALDALRLRERAERLTAEAARAREIHHGLAGRHRTLQGRLDGVRARHRPDVWASAAATRSRAVLERELGFGLWLALGELGTTMSRLLAAADERERQAAVDRRRADEIERALTAAGGG